jgi:hypothetical protein
LLLDPGLLVHRKSTSCGKISVREMSVGEKVFIPWPKDGEEGTLLRSASQIQGVKGLLI